MMPSQQLERARRSLRTWIQEHATETQDHVNESANGLPESDHEVSEMRESIFVCDGFYRGRRFRTETLAAVWFAEEDELKIHAADGQCLACLNADAMALMAEAQPVESGLIETELAETHSVDVLPMHLHETSVGEPDAGDAMPQRRAA